MDTFSPCSTGGSGLSAFRTEFCKSCSHSLHLRPYCRPHGLRWGRRLSVDVLQSSSRRRRMVDVHAGIDDEFRSSRSIAAGLHSRYRAVGQNGYSRSLKEFVRASVTAYAVGCTEEGLRKELAMLKETNEERLRMADLDVMEAGFSGRKAGALSLLPHLTQEELEDCMLWLTIIFITITCTPQTTVVRWASSSPVSADSQLLWRGFCTLISNAYYTQGMAWFSIKRLQLEQLAVAGEAEEASIVADRMRLVFTTLEVIDPRWGGLDYPTL